jgi:NAD(P) transhydrogenase subunit alpha
MPEALLNNLYIFVLAMFTGFEVITKVPPLLHTPLMSGSNAISGISVVGALIITAEAAGDNLILLLGVIAVAMGMINVAGGFLVTDRMLEMFKKKPAAGGGEKS